LSVISGSVSKISSTRCAAVAASWPDAMM